MAHKPCSHQRAWNFGLACGQVLTLALLLSSWRQPVSPTPSVGLSDVPLERTARRLQVRPDRPPHSRPARWAPL